MQRWPIAPPCDATAIARNCFVTIPFVPTLEGQYIIKNLVLISAGIVVGATVRGGRIVPEPRV